MSTHRPRLDAFQKLALFTTASTYLLILVGVLVRAAGAGLGCPDWPRCFGRWIPPTSASQLPAEWDPALFNVAHTWLEYVNRLLGASVGLLMLATLILALIRHRDVGRIVGPTLAASLLVIFQAWLGGQVVRSGLQPWMVTAHLVLALIIVSLLLYATVNAFFPEGRRAEALPNWRVTAGRLGVGLLLLTLLQIGLGTQVRAAIGEALQVTPELPRSEWLSTVGKMDHLHRQAAVVVLAAAVGVWSWLRRRLQESRQASEVWLSHASNSIVALSAAQIVAGLLLAYADVPAAAQVIHLSLASLMLGAVTGLILLARRLPVR